MKKICFLIFVGLFALYSAPCYPCDLFNSNKREIRSTLIKHNRALDNHDFEKLKTFYDKDYKSSDGLNLDKLTSMLERTYSIYKNITYKSKINNISLYDDWALVQMSDKTMAKVYPIEDKKYKKDKMGLLEGTSSYNVYLKKKDGQWKIICDDIIMEETSLKYGIANEIDMDLVAPVFVENGKEYDLSLKMNKPEDIVAIASISREEVSYPPHDYQEKFRRFPQTGDLERIVKANNQNHDEYAVASVGFTKVSVNEEQMKARIEVLGMAYIMKRVNMDRQKAVINNEEEKKDGV